MSSIQKFKTFFAEQYKVQETPDGIILGCVDCNAVDIFTKQALNYRVRNGIIPPCKNCQMKTPEGFTLVSNINYPIIKCDDCGLKYHHEKKTTYLKCYCRLKTKKHEHILYKKLVEDGYIVYREKYFDKSKSSHKTDLVALINGREIWIELDDLNHFYESSLRYKDDCDFTEMFLENRQDNQYQVRLQDTIIGSERCLEKLIKCLKSEDLDHFTMFTTGKSKNLEKRAKEKF